MNNWIYIALMALTTFAIRVLPLTLIRRQITNKYIRSFLKYVPYVTISVMTFPAIIEATKEPLAGLIALAAGMFASWKKLSMFTVAAICCAIVFVLELIFV